jgi:hypothetical protein
MDWKTLLAYISGSVDKELLLRNAYLTAENRILRNQITGRLPLSDAERQTLAEIGKKLGKKALEDVAQIVKPDTILAWHRNLAADKFDDARQRKSPGRPRVNKELEDLVVHMEKENRGWGYDRLAQPWPRSPLHQLGLKPVGFFRVKSLILTSPKLSKYDDVLHGVVFLSHRGHFVAFPMSRSDGITACPVPSSPARRARVVGLEKAAGPDAAPTVGDITLRILEGSAQSVNLAWRYSRRGDKNAHPGCL